MPMLFRVCILLCTSTVVSLIHAVSLDTIKYKLSKYLQHDSEIENHYLLGPEEISFFSTKADKLNNKPESIVSYANQMQTSKQKHKPDYTADKPLAGLKVAIDAGHLGGDMAQIEARFVNILQNSPIYEGNLTIITAKILKNLLTEQGAQVLLTRDAPGQSAYAESFSDWCLRNLEISQESDWLDSNKQEKIMSFIKKNINPSALQKTENIDQKLIEISNTKDVQQKGILIKQALFRFIYNLLDLNARAEKINDFKPDLTIVIHFNATGESQTISNLNFNVAFIPGSFLANGLDDTRSREEFARLTVTNDIEESLKLSKEIISSLACNLDVPAMTSKSYQPDLSIFIEDGIYCRNLTLNRLVHGPVCYIEALVQNNTLEAPKLAQQDFEFEGTMVSSRLVAVAKACFTGVRQYLNLEGSGNN